MTDSTPNKVRIGYEEFVARYTGVLMKGVLAWNTGDPLEQAAGLHNAEQSLAAADQVYPHYVDRAALLGPELGGTVTLEL